MKKIFNLYLLWIISIFSLIFAVVYGKIRNAILFACVPIIFSIIFLIDKKSSKKPLYKHAEKLNLLVFLVITFLALPWLFSIVSIDISKIPLLNSIFLYPNHLHLHHGYIGWYLLSSALLISNQNYTEKTKKIVIVFLAFLIFFGAIYFIDDFIREQIKPRV